MIILKVKKVATLVSLSISINRVYSVSINMVRFMLLLELFGLLCFCSVFFFSSIYIGSNSIGYYKQRYRQSKFG